MGINIKIVGFWDSGENFQTSKIDNYAIEECRYPDEDEILSFIEEKGNFIFGTLEATTCHVCGE